VPAEDCLQLDFDRLDLSQWADPATDWPEERRAELAAGWVAYDRSGQVAALIEARTRYSDEARMTRLDEALLWLDQHLSDHRPQRSWQTLGPAIAHDRLQAAYGYLVQALFAYNRRWRPWRNRQASALLALPWLPEGFAERVLPASNAPLLDETGYLARVEALRGLCNDLVARLVADGLYGEDPAAEAFFRSHDEPGWAHNMDQWKAGHRNRAE
jgi:hypothetical protein